MRRITPPLLLGLIVSGTAISSLTVFMRLSDRRRDVTIAAGYADRSHLVADCRALAGRTPGALLANQRMITSRRRTG